MNLRVRSSEFGVRSFFSLFVFFLFTAYMMLAPQLLAEEEFVYKAGARRDPMIPLVTPQGLIRDIKSLERQGGIFLEGIISDKGGGSLAIINGQIVKAGDTIGEIKILRVYDDRVIILKDDKQEEIKLEEEGE